MSSPLYEALARLSDDTAARLERIFTDYRDGRISEGTFHALANPLLTTARAQGVALADLSLAASVAVETGAATPVLGLTDYPETPARLTESLSVLLTAAATEENPLYRIVRFGRSEPAHALQDAFVNGLRQRGIPGYVRKLSPGACTLCQWLWKEGYVYPASKSFHKHVGCLCHPVPAFREGR